MALQHRGQESAGIVTSEGVCSKSFHVHKGMGMINNIFNDENMRKLKGNLGIGHTRYSTSAASEEVNCQPFVVHTAHGALAVAHNGELVNTESLRKMVMRRESLHIFLRTVSLVFFLPSVYLLRKLNYILISYAHPGIRSRRWFVDTLGFGADNTSALLESTGR